MYVRERDLQTIARLWNELAAFPAAHIREAMTYCLAQIAHHVGSEDAFLVSAHRDDSLADNDGLLGWRPRVHVELARNDERDARLAQVLKHFDLAEFDPQTRAVVASAGTTRAFLRGELVDDTTWKRSWLYNDVLRPLGIRDRLLGAHPVGPFDESYMGFDRGTHAKPFGDRERDFLYVFLCGAPVFHTEATLAYGPLGESVALTPRELDVLHLLLTDLSEREIAATLGMTPRTTHWYAVALFRKFNVSGRIGLMARWLRQPSNITN